MELTLNWSPLVNMPLMVSHDSFPDVAPVCSDFELAVRDLFIWCDRLVKQVEQQDDYEHEREPNGQVFVGWIHLILYTFLAFCECSL